MLATKFFLSLPGIIAESFDIWGILKMASVKSVEPGNNCFGVTFTVGILKICPVSDLILI